jgi:hypothetical protein
MVVSMHQDADHPFSKPYPTRMSKCGRNIDNSTFKRLNTVTRSPKDCKSESRKMRLHRIAGIIVHDLRRSAMRFLIRIGVNENVVVSIQAFA